MLTFKTLKDALQETDEIRIFQPDGTQVPPHFHITEAGLGTKHFIDCGGTIRKEESLIMQVWYADDTHHRLTPATFLKILDKASPLLQSDDVPVEIEYQMETIGKFRMGFDGSSFQLIPTQTECLAMEKCGVNEASQINENVMLENSINSCSPGTSCC